MLLLCCYLEGSDSSKSGYESQTISMVVRRVLWSAQVGRVVVHQGGDKVGGGACWDQTGCGASGGPHQ